jgi:hypothetical protein
MSEFKILDEVDDKVTGYLVRPPFQEFTVRHVSVPGSIADTHIQSKYQ